MRWFCKGDLDGLFALGLNNFINFLLIINLSIFVLGFEITMVAGRVLPAMAVGILFGNVFYAWQAYRIGKATGSSTVTALPYGINLLPIIFYTFYVMLPAQQIALAGGATKEEADLIAWKAGILACLGSGLIELIGSFFVHHLRRVTPRAAMLSALAVIGIFFIGADYCFRTWAYPEIGIPALILTLFFFYGGAKLRGNFPGGLLVLLFGVAVAWGTYFLGMPSPVTALSSTGIEPGLMLPSPDGLAALGSLEQMLPYLAVILPMGLINLVGSMQVIESAAAAGDDFPPRETLVVNGVGTMLSGVFGSPFPTTLYIGHNGMKDIGAGAGYSLLNGLTMAFLAFTGSLGVLAQIVPIEAGMAILIWVGLTIGSQAFQATPARHAPAVVLGLIPGIGAFAALIVKRVMGSLGYGTEAAPYSAELFSTMAREKDLFATGIFALEQGWLYASVVLTSVLCAIIDRDMRATIGWLLAGSLLSFLGIIHGYRILANDVSTQLGPAWHWVAGYLLAAGLVLLTRRYLVVPEPASAPVAVTDPEVPLETAPRAVQ